MKNLQMKLNLMIDNEILKSKLKISKFVSSMYLTIIVTTYIAFFIKYLL
jgi:hypothetical protein